MMVEQIEQLHHQEGLTYRKACEREGVSHTNFIRWRQRHEAGREPASPPGPHKVEPLELDGLREEVRTLRHGRHRTAGTGELYEEHRDAISRRDLTRLVREAREQKHRDRNRIHSQVRWLMPRLIWALDDTEYRPEPDYPKAHLHNVQDLGSRYKFEPIVGLSLASGEEVAMHLRILFRQHGPPLFLKRDNKGNLNHHDIRQLLGEFFVIPVNSPLHYAPYNGGIEHAHGEIKEKLRSHAQKPMAFLAIQAELDIQAINHRRRGCLRNRTACQVFTEAGDLARVYTRRKRKEVYDWIENKTLELIGTKDYDADEAWRRAVQTWLLDHHFIALTK
jgi:hypothetical protein